MNKETHGTYSTILSQLEVRDRTAASKCVRLSRVFLGNITGVVWHVESQYKVWCPAMSLPVKAREAILDTEYLEYDEGRLTIRLRNDRVYVEGYNGLGTDALVLILEHGGKPVVA